MSEEIQDGVAESVVQEIAETQETQEQPPQETPPPARDEKREAEERNFRNLREQKERAERERDEAIQYARSLQQQKPAQPEPEEEPDFNIPDDDYIEAKHVKKVMAKLRDVEKRLAKQQPQSTENVVDVKLKSQFPDFEKVTTQDNLQRLAREYPEIASTIHNSNGDLYSKAVTAYTMIKKFDIYKEDLYEADREVVQRNAVKPKPSVSIAAQQGASPLTKANEFGSGPLTPELKKKIYEAARKAAGMM